MQPAPKIAPNRSRYAMYWTMGFSWANLCALMVVSVVLFWVSEDWWLGAFLTFAPRTPFLIPAVGLLLASCVWHRESIAVNLISLSVVLVPIMGLVIPFNRASIGDASPETKLTIVSCNVQRFRPDFAKILAEIQVIGPNVVALQEALPLSPLLDEYFRDWNVVHHNSYWIASKYPVKQLAICETTPFERIAGIAAEIETPSGPIVLCDIHQMTARPGLQYLSARSFITGEGISKLEGFIAKRNEESIEIRDFVESARNDKPLLVMGDFNTPTCSVVFQRHWGDLQSSYDVAGFGYGYTSPCKGNRYWPDDAPWARIDHILCSQEWQIGSCHTGHSDGSDHRLITATVQLGSH